MPASRELVKPLLTAKAINGNRAAHVHEPLRVAHNWDPFIRKTPTILMKGPSYDTFNAHLLRFRGHELRSNH